MKKTVNFGVLAAACVMIFGGCSGNKTAVKGEALDQPATSTNTKLSPAPTSQKPEAVTSDATAKMTKGTSSALAKQTKEAASATTSQPGMEQMKSDLETIYFDFDSATLSEQSRKALTSNANYLKKHSDVSIRIEGNCDERGSAEYNIALGEKRARAALKYLSTLGIDDSRLSLISNGNEKPVVQGHDESAWAKNRRDDFVIPAK